MHITRMWLPGLLLLFAFSTGNAGNIKGKITAKGVKNAANTVIYIDSMSTKLFKAPEKHAEIDQLNMVFQPHVLPVLTGTTVDFLNNDVVLHNVFSPDKCAENFNLGTWPKGQIRSYTFKNVGCRAVILCNVHPEMEAYVVVLQNPYYAVSAKDGAFEIKDVPAGKYLLDVWHEKLKGEPVSVEVPEKGDVTVNFKIKK